MRTLKTQSYKLTATGMYEKVTFPRIVSGRACWLLSILIIFTEHELQRTSLWTSERSSVAATERMWLKRFSKLPLCLIRTSQMKSNVCTTNSGCAVQWMCACRMCCAKIIWLDFTISYVLVSAHSTRNDVDRIAFCSVDVRIPCDVNVVTIWRSTFILVCVCVCVCVSDLLVMLMLYGIRIVYTLTQTHMLMCALVVTSRLLVLPIFLCDERVEVPTSYPFVIDILKFLVWNFMIVCVFHY